MGMFDQVRSLLSRKSRAPVALAPVPVHSISPPVVESRPVIDVVRAIELRDGGSVAHFSSSILIGLESALRDLAAATPDDPHGFIPFLTKTIGGRTIRLPAIPEVVVQLDALLRQPECSIAAVADRVATEPGIATRLVGIANSSFYASPRRITAIDVAVTRLGLAETKNLVQALAFGSKLFRVPGWEREAEQMYHRALVSATAARAVGEGAGLDGDELFMAGLMHDLGRLVVLSTVAELEHTKKVWIDRGLVTRVLDAIHEDLSALVAESWNASLDVVVACRFHHRPALVAPTAARRYAHTLRLADGIAELLLDPRAAARGLESLSAESVDALGVRRWLDDLVACTRENAEGFDVPLLAESAPAGGAQTRARHAS